MGINKKSSSLAAASLALMALIPSTLPPKDACANTDGEYSHRKEEIAFLDTGRLPVNPPETPAIDTITEVRALVERALITPHSDDFFAGGVKDCVRGGECYLIAVFDYALCTRTTGSNGASIGRRVDLEGNKSPFINVRYMRSCPPADLRYTEDMNPVVVSAFRDPDTFIELSRGCATIQSRTVQNSEEFPAVEGSLKNMMNKKTRSPAKK